MNATTTGGPFNRPPDFFFGVLLRLSLAAALSLVFTQVASGQTTTLLEHSFDGVTAPDLPAGVTAETTAWKTSTSSPSPGSGLNNLAHTGSTPSAVVLGPIDLSSASAATLTYYARRTSSYPADSLLVRFSIDGGTSFPHIFSSGGLPAEASTYEFVTIELAAPLLGEPIVYLQFDGRGGSSSGANIRIDDVLITAPLDLSSTSASFGFAADSSLWNPDDGALPVSFDLSWPGPESIQGFQFDLGFDASLFSLNSVTSNHSSLNGAGWQITQNGSRVVVVNLSSGSLEPGNYSDLLTSAWSFVGSPLAQDSVVAVSISNLLVAESSPTGGALSLPNGRRSHIITVEANLASITVSSDSLHFGNVTVGDSASVSLFISNPTGMADLRIDSVRTSSGAFFPATVPATVAPASTESLVLWFKPAPSSYGALTGNLVLYHNAPSGSTIVRLAGNWLGGRGDSDGDGAFDVADVIQSLDVVAGIASSTPETLHRFYLYPYPDGDSEIDVRDLTVQIQAILHSAWPDGAPLTAVIPAPVSGKGGNASASLLAQGASLFLDTNTPIRGFQLEFRMRSQPVSPLAGKSGLSVSSHFDAESMTYRTLMFTNHNELLPAGKHSILDGIDQQAEFISGIVVTDAKEKLNIYTLGGFSTPVEIPISQRSSEIEMYPNPVSISGGSKVSLKFAEALKEETGEAEVEIVDLLGRALLKQALTKGQLIHEIDLSKVVRSPGIHFVRIHSGLSLTVMPFLVVP